MKSEVVFAPRVGNVYGATGSVFKKRTVILGGSHYGGNGAPLDKLRDFTQEVVEDYLARCGENWCKTYTTFINSVYGRGATQHEREQFFESVVFYTFLQDTAGAGPYDADKSNYSAEQHFAAFREILDKHKPEVVISWGGRVWDALPNNWGYGEAVKGEPITIGGTSFGRYFDYPYRDWRIVLVGVDHPSIGYARDFHHEIFQRLGLV